MAGSRAATDEVFVTDPRDYIELDGVTLQLSVGILEREHLAKQSVDLRLRLGLDLERCGVEADLDHSVNYAEVLDQVTALASSGHWRLLESLGRAIALMLLRPPAAFEARAAVAWVEVVLRKPEVLGGRGVPSVRLLRHAGWTVTEPGPIEGSIVLHQEATLGAYEIELGPLDAVQLPVSAVTTIIAGEAQEDEPGRWCAGAVGGRLLTVTATPWTTQNS